MREGGRKDRHLGACMPPMCGDQSTALGVAVFLTRWGLGVKLRSAAFRSKHSYPQSHLSCLDLQFCLVPVVFWWPFGVARDSRFTLYIPIPYMESSVSPTSHGFFFHEIVLQDNICHFYILLLWLLLLEEKTCMCVFMYKNITFWVQHEEVLEIVVVATHLDTLNFIKLYSSTDGIGTFYVYSTTLTNNFKKYFMTSCW